MTTTENPSICIIGGGISGTACLKECLVYLNAYVDHFNLRDKIHL